MSQLESNNLPVGWVVAPIEELFARQSDGKLIHQGWSPQCHREAAPDGEWGVLKTTAIQDGYFLEYENKHLPSDKPSRERLEVKSQDFLLTCAGPRNRCGISTLVRKTREKLLISGKMYRFRVYENFIAPSYLEAWLRTFTASQFIDSIKTGISESGLNITHARFKPMPVIVAPFDEQKRIVEKLDSLLAQVDTIQQRLNNLPDIIKRFRQSVLAAAVSGKLTEQWREFKEVKIEKDVSIEELCANSFYGPRFSKDDYSDSGIPTIRTTDMTKNGGIKITESTPRIVVPEQKMEIFGVRKDDLLITRTGSIGTMAIFKGDYPAIPSAYLIRFRFNERVKVQFLYMFLTSPLGLEQMGLGTTAITQPNINAKSIKSIKLDLPCIEEQTEIVRLVEQYFDLADTLEKNLANAKLRVDNLTQSILAKAFRGELVPQDPNDEPADKLLERIKAARLEAEKLEKAAKKAAKASKAKKK